MSETKGMQMTAEVSYERAAQGLAGSGRRLGMGAWREVQRTGALPGDPEPDDTAAGLVRRWYQHLAVAMDTPMERLAPGPERLPELVTAQLDLARRTERVRAHVAATGGRRATAEADRQRSLLAGLLAQDLALLGAPQPLRSARDLLAELDEVTAVEDAAGRPLPRLRRTLVQAERAPETRLDRVLDRLAGWLRPTYAG